MTVDGTEPRPRLTEQVAEEIRALLARRRISGRELARRMGASHSWVNFRLTGAQPMTLDDLQRFAEFLNVEVTDLLPRANEGRALTTVGQIREGGRSGTTGWKFGLTDQPRPNGQPKRTQPHPSTRRPGRVVAAHATR